MDYFEEAQKARAYIQTTAQYGPNKQLLDFINYDGNLYTDLGLESLGLETMSLITQHEMLLSKLNPDHLEEMAMEDLKKTVAKFGEYLSVGGALVGTGGLLALSPKLAGIGIASILAGLITIKLSGHDYAKDAESKVIPFSATRKIEDIFDRLVSDDERVAKSMPSGFSTSAWRKYFDSGIRPKYFREISVYTPLVYLDKSDWTVDNFKHATQWYVNAENKLSKIKEAYSKKIDNLQKFINKADPEYLEGWDGDEFTDNWRDDGEWKGDPEADSNPAAIYFYIYHTISNSHKLFHRSDEVIKEIKSNLSKVAHRFEETTSPQ